MRSVMAKLARCPNLAVGSVTVKYSLLVVFKSRPRKLIISMGLPPVKYRQAMRARSRCECVLASMKSTSSRVSKCVMSFKYFGMVFNYGVKKI